MELISVILPIYNVADYLRKCLDSILSQTYQNLEIILVDDGSTDHSPEICAEYAQKDDRIIVLRKKNGGLSDARNAGIEIAKGEYLTFVDSDDYVEPDYVEFLYGLVKKFHTKMSVCSHRVIYENGTVLEKETREESVLSGKEVLERILYHEDIDLSAWAKLYHHSLFKDIRFPVGRLYEDAATTYRFVDAAGQIAIGSQSKLNYIMRGNSISNMTFSRKKLDLITSTREMADYCTEKYPELKKASLRRLTYAYLSTLSQLANSSVEDKEVEKKLIHFLRTDGLPVLFDSRAPGRDRLGIASALFGYRFYKYIWNLYRRLTGRI